MRTAALFKFVLAMLSVTLLSAPCLGDELKIKNAPNWVNDGSIYTTVQGERLFYGVGSAPPVGDRELQLAILESRARRMLQDLFSPWLDTLSSDYLAAANGDRTVDANAVSQQFKSLGKVVLPQAKLVARWKVQYTGSMYGLAQLDMRTVKEVVGSSQEIDASVRTYLLKHGDEVFDRLLKHSK